MRIDLLRNVSRATLEQASSPLLEEPAGGQFGSLMSCRLEGASSPPVPEVALASVPRLDAATGLESTSASSGARQPFEGLRLGDRGPEVRRLQSVLRRWNSALDVGQPGVFDGKTRQALTLYKAIYGSGRTGQLVDADTARYLRQMEDGTFWQSPPPKTPAQEMLYHASRRLGTPYVMGGDGRTSTDCGMLTRQAMVDARVSGDVSRCADLQYLAAQRNSAGLRLAEGDPQAGDLMFYRVPTSQSGLAVNGVTHVTMYVGDGLMLAASSSRGEVVLQPVSDLSEHLAGQARVSGQTLASRPWQGG